MSNTPLPISPSAIIILHLNDPSPPEQRNAVLNSVDDIADGGEDDEEEDDDDCDDDVAFDHCAVICRRRDGEAVEVTVCRRSR